ncbi:hypothetical protein HDU76_008023, partial [Blyttiomyces sp. JEL0837]
MIESGEPVERIVALELRFYLLYEIMFGMVGKILALYIPGLPTFFLSLAGSTMVRLLTRFWNSVFKLRRLIAKANLGIPNNDAEIYLSTLSFKTITTSGADGGVVYGGEVPIVAKSYTMKKAILHSSKPRISPLTSVKTLPTYGRMCEGGGLEMERSDDREKVASSISSREKLDSSATAPEDSLVQGGDSIFQYRPNKASRSLSKLKQPQPPLHSIIKSSKNMQNNDLADGVLSNNATSAHMVQVHNEQPLTGEDETEKPGGRSLSISTAVVPITETRASQIRESVHAGPQQQQGQPQQPQRQRQLSLLAPNGNEEFKSSGINFLTEHIHKIALQEQATHEIHNDNNQPTTSTKKKILPINKSLKLLESLLSVLELGDSNITSIGIEGLAYTIAELISKLSAMAVIFIMIGARLFHQQPLSTTSTCSDNSNNDSLYGPTTIIEATALLATTLLIEIPYTFWEESQVGYDLMDVVKIFWNVKLGWQTYGTYLFSVGAAMAVIMAVEA